MQSNRPGTQGQTARDGSAPKKVINPNARSGQTGGETTPSMAQYLEIKAANPGSLLWYRMGDFYELFFDDAVVASAALGIVLTKRGKHFGEDIPMCGVPIHRADEYLQRLIRLGYRVAVAEQLEDPAEAKKRGAKAVVHRDVVRLVTPGTLTEDALLDAKARNYLTALFVPPDVGAGSTVQSDVSVALASLDISSGEFEVGEVRGVDLPGELMRLAPSEVILDAGLLSDQELAHWVELAGAAATPVPSAHFDSLAGEAALKAQLKVFELGGFGGFTRPELAAIAAALKYVELTQIGRKPVLRPPKKSGSATSLLIDAASRASLELTRSVSGEKQGSLLSAIDRTLTGPGARELAARLASPLRDPRQINERLDSVGFLIEEEALRVDVRDTLRSAPDIARAISRLAFARGSPRDLAAVRDGLATASRCARLLASQGEGMGLPVELGQIAERLRAVSGELHAALSAALVDDPPHLRREGGFVREGYRFELDDVRRLKEDSRGVMATLEAKYIEITGIKSLKVRHNNILGFYIEVSQGNAKTLFEEPLSVTFRHRQTMANAVRFSTVELAETEGRIASATQRALSLEHDIFAELAGAVQNQEQGLGEVAAALAVLDATAGLAELARMKGYVRPTIDDSQAFDIRGGRHPVVEQALMSLKAGPFIENDCVLGRDEMSTKLGLDKSAEAHIWLVTGPNMAGKSTFLRQNALVVVLAQMGSYVPARAASIGIVDRLFSRVGASDDLARGRSTFMVEMVETAAILNQASDRSLVILDEVGRGTATFDGLSIAWATVEFLHDVSKARVLFATHYHELTALARRLDGVANVTMEVREWRDEIVFLHKLKSGAADRSYGIQVAKLAGLPAHVVRRAREVLTILEKTESKKGAPDGLLDELPLFAVARSQELHVENERSSPVAEAIDALKPDKLTPRAALDEIYRLKSLRNAETKPKR